MFPYRRLFLSIFVFTFACSVRNLYAQDAKFLATVDVLKEAYSGEMLAQERYKAFADKATQEGYPNIAYLFLTLAYSESIHTANFKSILSELNADIPGVSAVKVQCSSTKENLRLAVRVELSEIDESYPRFIERIVGEGFPRATQALTYAWEAEKQHREILQKVNSKIGMFFGHIAQKIEQDSATYYVCGICGSTVDEIPKYSCPVCRYLFTEYQRMEKKKGAGE